MPAMRKGVGEEPFHGSCKEDFFRKGGRAGTEAKKIVSVPKMDTLKARGRGCVKGSEEELPDLRRGCRKGRA